MIAVKGNTGKTANMKQGAAPKAMTPAAKQVAPKKSIIEQMRSKNRAK
jgi:hypothetical protein